MVVGATCPCSRIEDRDWFEPRRNGAPPDCRGSEKQFAGECDSGCGASHVADPEDRLGHSSHTASSRCRRPPGDSEKATSLTGVAAHALACCSMRCPAFPSVNLLVDWILHPEPL